jgi:hypothetical protein
MVASSGSRVTVGKPAGMHASPHQKYNYVLLLLLLARKMDYPKATTFQAGVTD